jgi:hypothetical protein
MKKYKVLLRSKNVTCYEIEAKDEKEAEKIYWDTDFLEDLEKVEETISDIEVDVEEMK